MDISTKRFNVKSNGTAWAMVRDRNAPGHVHTVALSDLPNARRAAMMTERQYDDAVSAAIYK